MVLMNLIEKKTLYLIYLLIYLCSPFYVLLSPDISPFHYYYYYYYLFDFIFYPNSIVVIFSL